ncbi:MAG TPA: DUF5684 domain-containing protein [Armatimonadota bacterium]|nr:DUF5684 domain-containing protein [Armatimonadota bacterium]
MDPTLVPDLNPLPAILGSLAVTLGVSLAMYVYFGITLMIIAKKSNTQGAWLAWVPIGNIVLMFMIGRRPGWWIVLLFVPLVNVVIGVLMWMSMAASRGKPAWTGALALLPGIGVFIPIYLALGPNYNPDVGAVTRVCPSCGAVSAASDTFCGRCGGALPAVAPRAPVMWPVAVGVAALMFVGTLGAGAVGWGAMGALGRYTAPQRQAPDLPERIAGTITEFPVDTDPDSPLRPASVISKVYADGKIGTDTDGDGDVDGDDSATDDSSQIASVPEDWLPPGVEESSLPGRATSMTAATYTPATPTASPGSGGDRVVVIVLETPADPSETAGQLAGEVAAATGGETTGVEVVNPSGETYVGVKVSTGDSVVIILEKQTAPVVICIYAPTEPMIPAANVWLAT